MAIVVDREETTEKTESAVDGACVTVIFNPVSGQGDPEVRKARIEDALASHGYRCLYRETTPEDTARSFAERAVADGVALVGVSGGDGTVMEVMSALVGTDIPLAVFPGGTGNLLSVNLHLPHDVGKAADAALGGIRRPIDLARIRTQGVGGQWSEGQYFAILAGAGYDAEVIAGADRQSKNRLGMGAYLLSALRNLGRRRTWASIRLDGEMRAHRHRAKSVMVANMGSLQGNVVVVPDALPDDGILDVAVLKAESLRDWIRLVLAALLHRLRHDGSVEYLRATKVAVRFASPQPIQLDGEVLEGRYQGFEVEIVPQAVEVMAPREA